jgi:hypothetical protein
MEPWLTLQDSTNYRKSHKFNVLHSYSHLCNSGCEMHEMKDVPLERYIDCRGLRDFEPVGRKWLDIPRRYRVGSGGDSMWDYHERAQTGFMAAAVWLAGGVALEEWRTDKKAYGGNSRHGRGDLWLCHKRLSMHVEAKYLSIKLGRTAKSAARAVVLKLREASRDACHVPCARDERRAGMLFVAPWFPQTSALVARRCLVEWLKQIQGLEALAIAWTFDVASLERCRYYKSGLTPGIVLLVTRATGRDA